MTIPVHNCIHTYEEIIDALRENLPDAYLLDVNEREECLAALARIERVFARLRQK